VSEVWVKELQRRQLKHILWNIDLMSVTSLTQSTYIVVSDTHGFEQTMHLRSTYTDRHYVIVAHIYFVQWKHAMGTITIAQSITTNVLDMCEALRKHGFSLGKQSFPIMSSVKWLKLTTSPDSRIPRARWFVDIGPTLNASVLLCPLSRRTWLVYLTSTWPHTMLWIDYDDTVMSLITYLHLNLKPYRARCDRIVVL
jgi:hypothetical protein